MDDFPAFIAAIIGAPLATLLTLAIQKRSRLTHAAALLNAPAEKSERTLAGWALAEAAEAQAWKLIAKNEIRARPNTIAACFFWTFTTLQLIESLTRLMTQGQSISKPTATMDTLQAALIFGVGLWIATWLGAGLLGGGRLYPPVTAFGWESVREARASWIQTRRQELETQPPDLYPTPARKEPTAEQEDLTPTTGEHRRP